MSIFGAMFSGVTGLNAQSQALGMIADNIANVNTIGYKGTTAHFFSLVTQAASRTTFTPGGVASSPAQGINRQGLLQASTSKTDIAVAGRGFFVVNQSATSGTGQFLFTRAGSFDPDQNGNLVNTAGYFLQGWPLTDGTTLPTNTSTLSSVQTVNVANLAGTATPTSSVTLSLNLPSTAPAAAGGGQINSTISAPLNGITDIDYKTFGTLNDVARIDYAATGSTMTITIGTQTGTFDLSNRLPGIYKSTGTLAGMEITLNSSFDFTSNINVPSTALDNTDTVTNEVGIKLSDFALATQLNGVDAISLDNPPSQNDDIITVSFDNSTGVLTVDNKTRSQTGTVTIGTTGGTGVKDYELAGVVGSLVGGIVTIDTNTFDFATSFSDPAVATLAVKNGSSTAAATISNQAINNLDATTLATLDANIENFTLTITETGGADTVGIGNNGAVFVNASLAGDGTAGATTYTITVDDGGGRSFDVVVQTSAALGAGETLVIDVALPVKNRVAVEDGAGLVLTAKPKLINFDAKDLAALDTTQFNFNVDITGRVTMPTNLTQPKGFTLDPTSTGNLATTGKRNVVVTDGTNSFTIELDVTAAITAGSQDIAIDLKELTNSFGLGTAPGEGRFSATMQIFDSLGNAHDLIVDFDKTATNQWQILVNDPVLASTGVKSGTVAAANRSITFNGDGTPSAITFPTVVISAWTTGANDSSVAIDLGTVAKASGVTQFAGEFALSSIDQNGVTFGGFVGINIADDGKVTAVFDNGEQLAIFQLPLSLFANPNGLEAVTGNAFRQTDKSGDILLQQAATGGSGSVASSALESSTVDLAEEFTKMITTQRAYSASAKIITTADEMLEELIRIRR